MPANAINLADPRELDAAVRLSKLATDVYGATAVELLYSTITHTVWVNIDGICACRIRLAPDGFVQFNKEI